MAITFDGPNLTIILDTAMQVDVGDIYSAWKQWQLNGNLGYPPAFRTVGGDPLGGGLNAAPYFFLANDLGWRIRPAEADLTVTFFGNLIAEDPALPLFTPTLGDYTVLVAGVQPVTQGVTALATDMTLSRKILQNRSHTNPATGVMTIFDDDDSTALVTANLYEDIAGTVPYDTESARIDRRNRLE